MKKALSAGLVAVALTYPTSVAAGSTCPKTAYGSNRVTCFAEVDQTDIHLKDHHHHHHDDDHEEGKSRSRFGWGRKNKKKDKHHHHQEIETARTVHRFAWSFLWNYVVTDECPNTDALLATVLPMMGNANHLVNCRIEVKWSPTKALLGNQSWDFAGHGAIDGKTLPARMEWPLFASFHRPDHFIKSRELGIKYDSAKADAENMFEVSLALSWILSLDVAHALSDPCWPRRPLLSFLGPRLARRDSSSRA
jgi:hypothetical protein